MTGLRRLLAGFALLLLCAGAAVSAVPHRAFALTDDQKAALQAQYNALEQEIAQWQTVLTQTQAKKDTLQGNVSVLNAQIAQATAQIKQLNTVITQLGGQIDDKTQTIETLQNRIDSSNASLAKLLRQKNQTETESLAIMALSSGSLSDFYADLADIDAINGQLQTLFTQLKSDQDETQQEKDALAAQQSQELDAQHSITVKKTQISTDQAQQKQLLALTTQNEAAYQKVLTTNQAKAAAIKAALFPLRDAASINFGDALTLAQAAQKSTGVDPALVLAILTQESNLGANVGQCYLQNDSTGAGVGKNTGSAFAKVMSPTRDVPPFLALAGKLGFDPHNQVVSCPIASAGGWGGAMGPAQFIASTWALYANKIAADRGESVANPWDPGDAIMAMSLLLSDSGAGAGTYSASRTAAAKYYAGGGYASAAGQNYANQVMAKVDDIQQNIDYLNQNSQ